MALAFGTLMKKARTAKGMNGRALAKVVGVTPEYISYLEHGTKKPSMETVVKIAEVLNINHAAALHAFAVDQGEASQWLFSSRILLSLADSQPYTLPADAADVTADDDGAA